MNDSCLSTMSFSARRKSASKPSLVRNKRLTPLTASLVPGTDAPFLTLSVNCGIDCSTCLSSSSSSSSSLLLLSLHSDSPSSFPMQLKKSFSGGRSIDIRFRSCSHTSLRLGTALQCIFCLSSSGLGSSVITSRTLRSWLTVLSNSKSHDVVLSSQCSSI